MLLRTIIFFVVLYFLIKLLSRFFLPSSKRNKRNRSKAEFFYKVFNQYQQSQQQSQQQHQRNRSRNDNGTGRFDQVEEAEYEEIIEEETESTQK